MWSRDLEMLLVDSKPAIAAVNFDNDSGRFASPHPDSLDSMKCKVVAGAIAAPLLKIND